MQFMQRPARCLPLHLYTGIAVLQCRRLASLQPLNKTNLGKLPSETLSFHGWKDHACSCAVLHQSSFWKKRSLISG